MDHNKAIEVESAFRRLNGESWEHSADMISHDPVKYMRRGLLEHILGDAQTAEEAEMVIELSLNTEGAEQNVAERIIQLSRPEES